MTRTLIESVFEAMLRRSRDYCLLLDDCHRILAASDSFASAFGGGEDVRGRAFEETLDPGSRPKARAFLDAITDRSCVIELNHSTPEGEPRLVDYAFFRVESPAAGHGIAAVGRDQEASLDLVQAVLRLNAELEESRRQLAEQALTDPLTGLGNRRWLLDRLDALWADCRRDGSPCWAMMVDIDHFKSVNDSLGHDAGDAVLVAVAGALRDAIRRGDLAARHGGEEFCLAGPGGPAEAAALADRLLLAVRRLVVPVGEAGVEVRLTASLGVAVVAPSAGPAGPQPALQAADAALYRSKADGRDRVTLVDLDEATGDGGSGTIPLIPAPMAALPSAPAGNGRPG